MPMGTFIGRYRPIAIGTNASYDTKDEQAARFVALMNTATSTPAVPNTASGAVAKWVGVPIVGAAGTGGATATYNDQTKIAHGEQYLQVSSPDVTAVAVTAPIADAIDQAVFGSMTVDGDLNSATTTTIAIHSGESAVGALVAAAVAIDGFCYLLVGNEAEVIKVTAVAEDNITFTIVRGQCGSDASADWDDNEALYWYCGADNTVIGVDDESVWGTLASHVAAGGHLVVICGTEQMLVTDLVAGTIPDTMVVTRGYDGTTAAVHADNAAVTQYIDEDTCQFTVDNGALLVDECFYKPMIATMDGAITTGTEVVLHAVDTDFGAALALLVAEHGCAYISLLAEVMKVTAVASDNITLTVERAALGSTIDEDIADNTPVWQYREGVAADQRSITEIILVKSISTHVITCTRGAYGSPKFPIASGDIFFRCWAYEALDAALTAANATSGMPDFEEYGGTPICTAGTVRAVAEGHAHEGITVGANVTGTVTEET